MGATIEIRFRSQENGRKHKGAVVWPRDVEKGDGVSTAGNG